MITYWWQASGYSSSNWIALIEHKQNATTSFINVVSSMLTFLCSSTGGLLKRLEYLGLDFGASDDNPGMRSIV